MEQTPNNISMLTDKQLGILKIAEKEFPEAIVMDLNHTIGCTELAMYTKVADKIAILGVIDKTTRYAYLFTDDGDWVHGAGFKEMNSLCGVC